MNGILVAVGSFAAGVGAAWAAAPEAARVSGVPVTAVAAAVAFFVNWIAWVPAAIRRTEHFYDLVGSLTYLVVVTLAVGVAADAGTLTLTNGLPAAFAGVWAVRLGSFLFARVRRAGKDRRFDELKQAPLRFLVAWSLQGLWVTLTILAVLVRLSRPATLDTWFVIGAIVWMVGFGVEVVADRQKTAFRADPANAERWIDTGLWSWSRHPNYLGEIVLWTGIFLCGAGGYVGTEWLAVLSPLFVTVLLTRGSGVPLLEASARKRWGDDPAWQAYVARTPVLVPRPWRR